MLYIFIDDEEICNLISTTKLLQVDPTANILTFESGREAIQYFQENKDRLSADKLVIFLDMNMPGMNGIDFLEEYNKLATSLKAIIYVLSSTLDATDKEAAFQFPVVKDFFGKPFQTSYLSGLAS